MPARSGPAAFGVIRIRLVLTGPLTRTVTRAVALSVPSEAEICRTYVPRASKVASVCGEVGVAKRTLPGPLIFDHATESTAGGPGNPSSLALPRRRVVLPRAAVRSGPAKAVGAALIG